MKKDKALVTRFDLQTMAEFSVAADVLGFRSLNALVHQMVHLKISEARKQISAEEFEKLVKAQKKETLVRSETKSKERLEILGELLPRSDKGIKVLPNVKTEKKKAG